MSVLPDHEIYCRAAAGMIAPYDRLQQKTVGKISHGEGSYGYDVRIGHHFKVFSNWLDMHGGIIDPKDDKWHSCFTEINDPSAEYVIIPANSFALGETVETFAIPRDVLCVVLGKSTYARCGVIVNVTPLEPEWVGKITIEISNTTPLPCRIYCNEGIAQILFFKADSICEVSYADKKGKYQGQTGLTLPTVPKQEGTARLGGIRVGE